jgi:hypothetical protein
VVPRLQARPCCGGRERHRPRRDRAYLTGRVANGTLSGRRCCYGCATRAALLSAPLRGHFGQRLAARSRRGAPSPRLPPLAGRSMSDKEGPNDGTPNASADSPKQPRDTPDRARTTPKQTHTTPTPSRNTPQPTRSTPKRSRDAPASKGAGASCGAPSASRNRPPLSGRTPNKPTGKTAKNSRRRGDGAGPAAFRYAPLPLEFRRAVWRTDPKLPREDTGERPDPPPPRVLLPSPPAADAACDDAEASEESASCESRNNACPTGRLVQYYNDELSLCTNEELTVILNTHYGPDSICPVCLQHHENLLCGGQQYPPPPPPPAGIA